MSFDKLLNGWRGLVDANRPIRLCLTIDGDNRNDVFVVQQLTGVETVCGGLEYSLLCLAGRAGTGLKHFIGCPIQLQFVTASGTLRPVSGIVSEVIEGGSDGALATYQLIVRDAFSLLEHTCNTRVFRNVNEVEITKTILDEWREANPIAACSFNVEFRIQQQYPDRSFTMQYNESTAHFLRRLWQRRGIAWFFKSGPVVAAGRNAMPSHTLVLFDTTAAIAQNPAGGARFQRDLATGQQDAITAWHGVRRLAAGRVMRSNWNYGRSSVMTEEFSTPNDQGASGNVFARHLDEYIVDPPQEDLNNAGYQDLCFLRMQYRDYQAKSFHGESGDRDMQVGMWRRIDGHPDIDTHPPGEKEFTITELRTEAVNNLPKSVDEQAHRLFAANGWAIDSPGLAAANTERQMRFTNRFTCVRRTIPIVSAYDPRLDLTRTPPQTAMVVGPRDNEICCDAAARIKIRFPATRKEDHEHARGAGSADNDSDSGWVRVASGWAGNRYGHLSLPRVGDEVVVIFLGGDPDQPLVTGRVHGGGTPPPSFDHTSVLPEERYLSGIVSREGRGRRINQLRMDDTPGQISAQLASEHAQSQLNLGYLVHPRRQGAGEPRGLGAELRTDAALALRGGQGVLISADASLRAAGHQLARDGLAGLADALLEVQQQLAQLADTHHATPADGKEIGQLRDHVQQWDASGNTGDRPGAPVVAITAPAGIVLGSQAGIALGAQTHIDAVSVGNIQASAGRRLMLHAMESISLFAHALGAKLIAASGKVHIAAHDDDIELTAAKRIVLSASEEIILQAPRISFVSNGAQVTFGDGAITHQCSGKFAVKSASVDYAGGGDGAPPAVQLPVSACTHDQRVCMVDLSSGEPLANQRYRATLEDGQIVEGTTDAVGMTSVLTSTTPFARFAIEALDD